MVKKGVSLLRLDDSCVSERMFVRAGTISKTRTIAVLATPAGLSSHAYAKLKRRWITGMVVIEPDCYDWASKIEHDLSHHIDLEAAVSEMKRWQADVIILASSRYSSLKGRIETLSGPFVRVLDAYDI